MTERNQNLQDSIQSLHNILRSIGEFNIAVSGGIDSTLLAIISGRMTDVDATMVHAQSPAVPERATARVRRFAEAESWNLKICDVGEFQDDDYLENPVNRCFYCKTNLYQFIQSQYPKQILSGANCSDLSDYRPGLAAARQYGVRHPYIEAGIDKEKIREISRAMNLNDISELPASPCLSSRVETGIAIRADWLRVIDQVESDINQLLDAKTIRCRIRKQGIVVELDCDTLNQLNVKNRQAIVESIQEVCLASKIKLPISFSEYKMGSAFLHSAS